MPYQAQVHTTELMPQDISSCMNFSRHNVLKPNLYPKAQGISTMLELYVLLDISFVFELYALRRHMTELVPQGIGISYA